MTLYHLLNAHWEPGSQNTGVPRFSRYFKMAFPQVVQIKPNRMPRAFGPNDVVVTDNHLSLRVPSRTRTIVVHHGCAETHYDRDPEWQSAGTKAIVSQQREMFKKGNRLYVPPSLWVGLQFATIAGLDVSNRDLSMHERCDKYPHKIIPHWVPVISRYEKREGDRCPVVIGDWRNFNKGKSLIPQLQELCPDLRFKQLDFAGNDDEAKRRAYSQGDVYLCLSLSEGFSFSVADADAANMPIVTTEVGACYEYGVKEFADRDDLEQVARLLREAIDLKERRPSFADTWTFDRWQERWESVLR